jgi:hypothetical protein
MMTHRYIPQISGLFLVFYAFLLNASPVINVEETSYNCGLFVEGKNQVATAVFNVRNSGDSLLKITNVRTGCGCVVAAFDTLIPPGKSGTIKIEAKLNGYTGDITKSAVVTSNAKNEPTIRLTLNATIRPVIAISKQYISLQSSKDQKSDSLLLSSLKKDLIVTSIIFKPHNQNSTEWYNQHSIPITYELNKTDSISPDSFTVFTLLIKSTSLKESVTGEFIISTNHPDKKQISINGSI